MFIVSALNYFHDISMLFSPEFIDYKRVPFTFCSHTMLRQSEREKKLVQREKINHCALLDDEIQALMDLMDSYTLAGMAFK